MYAGFRIGGDAVTKSGTVAPATDGAKHNLIIPHAAAVEDEGTVDPSIGTDDEADPDPHVSIVNDQKRVGCRQSFRRANVTTTWQSHGLGYRSEF